MRHSVLYELKKIGSLQTVSTQVLSKKMASPEQRWEGEQFLSKFINRYQDFEQDRRAGDTAARAQVLFIYLALNSARAVRSALPLC